MKIYILSGMIIASVISFFLCSCGKDDEELSKSTLTKSTSKNISKPTVSVSSRKANSAYDGWWVIAKVTTGGDAPDNVECYLEWSKFNKKQTGTINYTNRDRMNVQSSSKSQVIFKKEHAGINSGNYIYYRLVGSNSKYTVTGDDEYMVATTY